MKRNSRLLAACAFLNLLAGSPAIAAEQRGDWTFLAAGDLLGPYGEALRTNDPGFKKVVAIVSSADVAMANHEGSVFDIHTFQGSMAAENGGGYPLHTVTVMRGLKDIGFDLIARANNHSLDWGAEGMRASDEALDTIGLRHAGTGPSMEAARSAALLSTAKGRIAFLSAASSFTGMSPASNGGRGAGPRPGVASIRAESAMLVSPAEMEALRQIAVRNWASSNPAPGPGVKDLELNGGKYRVSDKVGLTYEVSSDDVAEELAAIAKAKADADRVIFTIHAHETNSTDLDDTVPADFLAPLFHKAIDAGADAVVRTGPHNLQGIEIYKGKPIFYGMGSFFMDLPRTMKVMNQGIAVPVFTLPSAWYESAVATASFRNGALNEIRIYPLLLDQVDGETRGYPRPAEGADAVRILRKIEAASRQFGTTMRIAKGVGIIDGPGKR